MASLGVSITLPAPRNQIPDVVHSPKDVEHLYKNHAPDSLLEGPSRRNWLQQMIEKAVNHYQLNDLAYFSSDATVLSPGACQRAAASIEALFEALRENPESLITLTGQTMFSQADVLSILNSLQIEKYPSRISDDGDDILYFIAYLKAQKQLLQQATADKLHVVLQYS